MKPLSPKALSEKKKSNVLKCWGFPGGVGVRVLGFYYHGPGSMLDQGTEILQAVRRSKKSKKKKDYPVGQEENKI